MINELSDNDILDFLMTSDFEGDYSPVELKYLLIKWRYFYRILYGNSDRQKVELDGELRMLKDEIINLKKLVESTQIDNANLNNTIDSIKNRNLTWKERFSGKIITSKNED